MGKADFAILEYTQSDFDLRGDPFVIAINDNTQLTFLVSKNWTKTNKVTSESDREYIEDFIHELAQQQFRSASETEYFFDSIRSLGVGPIRTGTVGVCRPSSENESVEHVPNDGHRIAFLEDQVFVAAVRFFHAQGNHASGTAGS